MCYTHVSYDLIFLLKIAWSEWRKSPNNIVVDVTEMQWLYWLWIHYVTWLTLVCHCKGWGLEIQMNKNNGVGAFGNCEERPSMVRMVISRRDAATSPDATRNLQKEEHVIYDTPQLSPDKKLQKNRRNVGTISNETMNITRENVIYVAPLLRNLSKVV